MKLETKCLPPLRSTRKLLKKIRMRRFCTILWGTCSGKRDNLPRRKRNSKKSCKFPENYLATWKLGNIYLTNRQYAQALVYLKKAVQQKPDLPQAYRDMGRVYLQTHDYPRAVLCLKRVIQLSPDEPSAHYLLAQTYRKLGKNEEVKTEMELFAKLKKAQDERAMPPDITGLESNDEMKGSLPENLPAVGNGNDSSRSSPAK